MGIYHNPPPQPPTASMAGTTPEPHTPIGNQGDQPPRRQVAVALMMAAAVAAWPADLEPRLQRPNDQQQKIAPLTLKYGTQPIPSSFYSNTELGQIVASWTPPDPLPQLGTKSAGWNVPPILIVLPYVPLPKLIWTAWEPPYIAPPRPVSIVPLTLAYGQQPIPSAFLSPTELVQIVATWAQTWGAQLAAPSAAWNIPPPPPPPTQYALSVQNLLRTLAAWEQTWGAQTAPPNAAWNIPPIYVPFTPLPRLLWTSWEPPYIAPPRPVSIITLSLPTGIQPPPQSALEMRKMIAAVEMWQQMWGPQSAADSAAWNIFVQFINIVRMRSDAMTGSTMTGDTLIVSTMNNDGMVDSD